MKRAKIGRIQNMRKMKKMWMIILAGALALSIGACGKTDTTEGTSANAAASSSAAADSTDAPLLGGWERADSPEITEEAQAALDKALEDFTGSDIEAQALLGTQVVAGTNYAILCKQTVVAPDAEPAEVVAVIYQDLDGNAEFTDFLDIPEGTDTADLDAVWKVLSE